MDVMKGALQSVEERLKRVEARTEKTQASEKTSAEKRGANSGIKNGNGRTQRPWPCFGKYG